MSSQVDGVLVVDKPGGPTSHDVVARVRRALGQPRVGHTGTLDPGATGVLPLVLGRATRLAQFLSGGDKSYESVIRLGFSTDTGDAEGRRTSDEWTGGKPSLADVEQALHEFRGTFLQQPPAFSAKKIGGARSYRLARRAARIPTGVATLPAPVQVTAHALELVSLDGDLLTLRVICAAGFYVRALAQDLGDRLGTGAHLLGLRRTRSAEFTLAQAVSLETIERTPATAEKAIIPLGALLSAVRAATLTKGGIDHVSHGRDLGPEDLLWGPAARTGREGGGDEEEGRLVRLLDQGGNLIAVAREKAPRGALHPFVVLM
jgi:tRNA pseudouridine55 synthase